MTIQQKLDLFTQRTMESVNRQCREAAQEIQNAVKTAVSEAEEKARREMADRLKTETYRLQRESNKKIHAVSMKSRRDLFSRRERLIDELFTDLEKNLRDFTGTPAYKDFLTEGVTAVTGTDFLPSGAVSAKETSPAKNTDFSIIQLMAQDIFYKDLKELIESKTLLTAEATEEDFIGGFRLISGNRRMIADYTLLARMERLNENRNNLWHKRPDFDCN